MMNKLKMIIDAYNTRVNIKILIVIGTSKTAAFNFRDNQYHLLMAFGQIANNEQLGYHGATGKHISGKKIDFTKISEVDAGIDTFYLLQVCWYR